MSKPAQPKGTPGEEAHAKTQRGKTPKGGEKAKPKRSSSKARAGASQNEGLKTVGSKLRRTRLARHEQEPVRIKV